MTCSPAELSRTTDATTPAVEAVPSQSSPRLSSPRSSLGARPFAMVLSMVLVLIAGLIGPIGAVRADLKDDLQEEIEEVRDRIDALEAEAASAGEEYQHATAALAEARLQLRGLRAQVKVQRSTVAESQEEAGRRARAAYVSGGVDGPLHLLLSDDVGDFFFGQNALRRLAEAGQAQTQQHQSFLQQLRETEKKLAAAQARAADLVERRKELLARIKNRLASAKQIRDDLSQELKEELARERRERREAARRAAEKAQRELEARLEAERLARAQAAEAAREQQSSGGGSSGWTSPGGDEAGASATVPDTSTPPTQLRKIVVDYALAQVGKGYILGTEGPSTFDCSGLLLRAYEQIGVQLPRYSDHQYYAGNPVSSSEAQAGDIVFFNLLGAHHIGIYLGNGMMVHAANPSRGVVVQGVFSPWYGERFTGYARVIP